MTYGVTTPPALLTLLDALAGTRTVYILGAGASAPDVPIMKDLVRKVQATLREWVGGFYGNVERGPLHERVLPVSEFGVPRDPNDADGIFAYGTNEEALKLAIHMHLDPSALKGPPEQYRVFRLAQPNGIILNFNTDGLADSCPQRVVKMHGNVVPGYTGWLVAGNLSIWEQFDLAQGGIAVAPATLLYPVPEPEDYRVESRLIDLGAALDNAETVVIIGYSFGIGTDALDDQHSYDFFCKHLRDRPVKVVVVDPGGEGLVERLREELRTMDVVLVSAFWNLLARAILEAAGEVGACAVTGLSLGRVMALYGQQLDRK